VLACGAHLKNRACLLDGDWAHWSAIHGDLDTAESRMALEHSIATLQELASSPIRAVAHDLHPDFFSTHLAQGLAQGTGAPAIAVQHHHAHIAVAIAELGLNEPVIGVALDGMGWGTDASAWGGEVLWVGGAAQAHQWQRLGHLPALALPGGDVAAREPWRMAASVLHAMGRGDEIEARFAPQVGSPAARAVHTQLQRQFNCPPSTSAGRWFDAAAGALGISVRQAHEAQAAIALEQLAAQWFEKHTDDPIDSALDSKLANDSSHLYSVVAQLLTLQGGTPERLEQGAAQFHSALAHTLAHSVAAGASKHNTRQVVLGGGCFANQVLRRLLENRLQNAGLQTLSPHITELGDAGLALGQAWVAAFSLET
jgi:hydrogenase maturation protein HypF